MGHLHGEKSAEGHLFTTRYATYWIGGHSVQGKEKKRREAGEEEETMEANNIEYYKVDRSIYPYIAINRY